MYAVHILCGLRKVATRQSELIIGEACDCQQDNENISNLVTQRYPSLIIGHYLVFDQVMTVVSELEKAIVYMLMATQENPQSKEALASTLFETAASLLRKERDKLFTKDIQYRVIERRVQPAD